MKKLDSIVVTDKEHEVVACIPVKQTDGMIIKNGYNVYECTEEPFFDDVGGKIYYCPTGLNNTNRSL